MILVYKQIQQRDKKFESSFRFCQLDNNYKNGGITIITTLKKKKKILTIAIDCGGVLENSWIRDKLDN